MRIGVMTYWNSSSNYGQLLQCWALQRFLQLEGHEAYAIAYRRKYGILDKLKKLTFAKLVKRFNGEHRAVVAERERCAAQDAKRDFNGFRSKYLAFSPDTYDSLSALRANPPQADAYIAGSDQIWHESLDDNSSAAMYLDFGSARRIAYAASMGRRLQQSEVDAFKRLTAPFDAISVRERATAEECARYGVNAVTCVDPTLLLDAAEYNCLAHAVDEDGGAFVDDEALAPFVFAYVVNIESDDDFPIIELGQYSAQLGLSINATYASGYSIAREMLDDAETLYPSIPEWIGMIRDAQCVVTSSFHGAVFCVLFHKQFLVVPLADKRAAANERIESLLGSLGLGSRIYRFNVPFASQMDSPIDWAEVDEGLAALRETSIAFLREALAGCDASD